MSAALELQKAVWAALNGDAELTALVGPDKVFDRPPPHAPFPYVTFGRTSLADWSTATEEGAEQVFSLHAWSKGKGRAAVLTILDAVRRRLADGVSPAGHHLVNFRVVGIETRFDAGAGIEQGTITYRAVSEPA